MYTKVSRYLGRTFLTGFAALIGIAAIPHARADGTLTHMSGAVSVQKKDSSVVPGAPGTKVLVGDIVATGPGAYVRMEMTDGGEMVLRPDSRLKVESYAFNEQKPAEDNFVFSMLKGGLRTVTGLVGKRGNKDAYQLKTETATIGIRGTQFDLRVCAGNCGSLANGTYLAVRFGAVQTTNAQGTLPVAAGQVAHVPPARPPVILPRDPGIGFTPPPVIPKLDEKKKIAAAAAVAEAAKATEKPAEKPADKPADKPGEKGSDKGDSKTEKKTDTKTETKTETKAETKAETKTDAAVKPGTSAGSNETGAASSTTTATTTGSGGSTTPASTAAPATSPLSASAITFPNSPLSAPGGGMDCSVQ